MREIQGCILEALKHSNPLLLMLGFIHEERHDDDISSFHKISQHISRMRFSQIIVEMQTKHYISYSGTLTFLVTIS